MSLEIDLQHRHRKDIKEFQTKAASMKKSVPLTDKKRRKEILAEIEKLEKEMLDRHKRELDELNPASTQSTETAGEIEIVVESIEKTRLSDSEEKAENRDKTEINEEASEELEGKKLSRAQRRRLNKQAKIASMRAQEPKPDSSKPITMSSRTVERIKIKKVLDDNGFRIIDIPSDGNCLFSSLCHQLMLNGVQQSVPSLRAATADLMRKHADDYRPFLVHHETGDSFTDSDFINYCDELEKTNAWGSQLELRAISKILRWPIRVLQADGPHVVIGDEFESENKTPLTVVYLRHELCLGEHYNSVVPI